MLVVEAAGVEPATRVENTQLTDSEIASNAENATISKSAVQSLYKVCQEFPELQPSDFPAPCKSTLKRSCSISDFGRCMLQRNPRQFLNAFSFGFFQCAEQEDRLQIFRCGLYALLSKYVADQFTIESAAPPHSRNIDGSDCYSISPNETRASWL